MEGKKSALICISIVAIIIVASIGYFFVFNGASDEGITAMEGREAADDLAKEWNSSAILVWVSGGGKMYDDGSCESWRYSYSNNNPTTNLSIGYHITVYSNGSFETKNLEYPPSPNEISTWTIDSNDALDIAKSNNQISDWLDDYKSDDYIQSFFLTYGTMGSSWKIDFLRPGSGFGNNPHHAFIEINATTGEVLSVEVDN